MEDIIMYACREHVEIAIDDFVNDMEAAPQITVTDNEICSYCNEKAEYRIGK
ncbi:CxxH/CxxC protein [Sedimentibacter hydroxybenzoicus DSM 7310]|uniref:CxxH/CxxC protein n=1 Tax=Sedimentibacter hydroxybenzoicus DSM 7310 TaxID=1123245 RepID=A0A974GVB5_SEDHY|nr:CxxH/CxxC protein [Sedimentibacter hydroxybenzoicus]NYB73193.1 CxxH/CxxC protein [Sedimentibacter hydroxybenzoicus DSM 7310]